jgi:hypothetical protein
VIATNLAGSTNASALVTVTTKPKLIITEVLAGQAAPTTGHMDFWELSNLDDRPVNLRGYRYDDSSQSFAVSHVIGGNVIIQPGESIVFIEATAATVNTAITNFRAWWGTNLPTGLQIVAWTNGGAGLSQTSDAVNFWNAAATDNTDTIASVSFASAVAGRSFVYNPESLPIGGVMNILGTNGWNAAWAATQSSDIGSPGRIVDPLVLTATSGSGQINVTWPSTVGRGYALDLKPGLATPTWSPLTNVTAIGTTTTVTLPADAEQGLYRGRVIIPIP